MDDLRYIYFIVSLGSLGRQVKEEGFEPPKGLPPLPSELTSGMTLNEAPHWNLSIEPLVDYDRDGQVPVPSGGLLLY